MVKKRKAKSINLDNKPKRKKWLYYINYKNLSAEIQEFGYVFSVQKMVIAIMLEIILSITAGVIYKLDIPYIIVVSLVGLFTIPQLILNNYHNMYQQKRFSDANLYMEQMLYSFNKKKNVLESLKDVNSIFTDGPMKELVTAAINNIEYCYEENDVETESLEAIENEYKNRRLKRINKFILKARYWGGDVDDSTEVLLKDRAMWETRTIEYQNDRKKGKRNAIICILITLGVCLVPIYVLPSDFDISKLPFTQISSSLFIICCILLYARADKRMTIDWLDYEKRDENEVVKQYYTNYVNYDIKQEFKNSLIYLTFPAVLTLLGVITIYRYGTANLMAKCIFLLAFTMAACICFSCYIGRNIYYKKLVKEVNMSFPEWLIEIAILMQTENVQNAIKKSLEQAPPVLEIPLIQFLDEIESKPTQVEPYDNFMKELHLREIDKSMKLLFSFSEGKGSNKGEQVKQLLESNAKLMDKAEREANSDSLVLYQAFILYPSFIGTLKLLSDLTIFSILFLLSTKTIL